MNEITVEDTLYLFEGVSFLVWCLATLLFSRISVKNIEQKMTKEGIEPPVWDKGIGGRITMYAMLIVANKAAKTSPVEDEAILRHARNKDRKIALFYTISMLCSFIIAFAVFFYMDPRTNIEVDPLMPVGVR